MTRRDSPFRGEYGDDEPVTEWSEAEKHPGRAISVVVVLAVVAILIGLGLLVWAVMW